MTRERQARAIQARQARQARQAKSAGRLLARGLRALEKYDGDPSEVLEEARLSLKDQPGRRGAGLTLDAIEHHFTDDQDSYNDHRYWSM